MAIHSIDPLYIYWALLTFNTSSSLYRCFCFCFCFQFYELVIPYTLKLWCPYTTDSCQLINQLFMMRYLVRIVCIWCAQNTILAKRITAAAASKFNVSVIYGINWVYFIDDIFGLVSNATRISWLVQPVFFLLLLCMPKIWRALV